MGAKLSKAGAAGKAPAAEPPAVRLHLVVQPNGGVHVDLVPRQVALRLKVKGKHVNVRLVPADAKDDLFRDSVGMGRTFRPSCI